MTLAREKNIKKIKVFLIFLLLILIMLVSNFYKYNFLPDKYFYDSEKILALINGSNINYGDSYKFAADIFRNINLFGFNSLLQWSVFLGFFGNLFLFYVYYKTRTSNIYILTFFILSAFLLNIYVFTLSKEMIQFLFYVIILLIYHNHFFTSKGKIIFILFICVIEGLVFRDYYLLVTVILFISYIVHKFYCEKKGKSFYKGVMVFITILLFCLIVLYFIDKETYYYLRNLRANLNEGRSLIDGQTILNDIIANNSNSPFIFILNYFLNFIRFLFPLELLWKGNIFYFGFFIYQLLILLFIVFVVNNRKYLTKDCIILTLLLASYFLVLVLFEPDFGSFIRHECVISPLIYLVISNIYNKPGRSRKGCFIR